MARASSLQRELDKVLNEFVDKERAITRETFEDVAQKTEQMVSASSPVGISGDYAHGWKVIKEGDARNWKLTVANPTNYQLTHLLEKGHQSKNQFGGPYKRVSARRHIKPAETWGVQELIQRLRKEL